jgi:predicted ATP-dependent endonuclease of OLD family
LSQKCQVIYTTHSPFMVQPKKLLRVRLVQDDGRAVGSRVTDDVLSIDSDTLFPLQGALGYDMVQHLFIAPHNLVVEGTSDFTYLSLISDYLREKNRVALDPKWSIVPVGGADLVPTFVALLGRHLAVTVLVDSRKEGHQRLQQLRQQGILKDTSLVTIGSVFGSNLADIEDLFSPDEYLSLFNEAFGTSFSPAQLVGSDTIVKRCARALGVERYDHGKPATVILRKYSEILPTLSEDTLNKFEELFNKINRTLV